MKLTGTRTLLSLLAAAALVVAGCGSDDSSDEEVSAATPTQDEAQPTIVVSTNILGDVVTELVGTILGDPGAFVEIRVGDHAALDVINPGVTFVGPMTFA